MSEVSEAGVAIIGEDAWLARVVTVIHLALSRGAAMSRSLRDARPLEPTAKSSVSIALGVSFKSPTIAADTPKFFANACDA